MARIGILGGPRNYYVQELQRAASLAGVETEIMNFQQLHARAMPDRPCAARDAGAYGFAHQGCGGESIIEPLPPVSNNLWTAVLVRTMPIGSLEQVIFRMDCLQVWESNGVPVINSSRCLETSIDKWLTLHRLHRAGILVPPTVCCQTRDQAMEAFDLLGEDVLVKPLFGGEGRGIIRLTDRELAWRTFSTLQQLGQVLYVQRFLAHFGYDVRILKIGDQLLSIRRRAKEGEFRTNVSQGGHAEPHALTAQQRELAVRCAAAVDGLVVGIDLLPSADGQCYALEVNAVPGWRAVESCLEVDVAEKIIRLAMELPDRFPVLAGESPG